MAAPLDAAAASPAAPAGEEEEERGEKEEGENGKEQEEWKSAASCLCPSLVSEANYGISGAPY